MKNIVIKPIAIALIALFAISCESDYKAPSARTKSFGLFANVGTEEYPTYVIQNELAALMDVSLGYLSHEWNVMRYVDAEWVAVEQNDVRYIRENSGIDKDDIDGDLTPFLMEGVGSNHSLRSMLFYFEKPGLYSMQIRNIYDVPVEYMFKYNDPIYGPTQSNRYYYSTPLESGRHLVERDVIYAVYANLNATATFYTDSACSVPFEYNAGDVIDLPVGSTIYCKDDLNGTDYELIDERIWSASFVTDPDATLPDPLPMATIDDSSAQVAAITFGEVGKFNISLSQRRENLSESIVIADSAEATFDFTINVI